MDISELLAFTVKSKGSDLHISSGEAPMIRVNGDMIPLKMPALEKREAEAMIYDIMSDDSRKRFEEDFDLDFSFALGDIARFRVNVLMQARGISAVMRVIPSEVLTLEALKAPALFKDISMLPRGICLVTGPTGSGKSTTLAAMIDYRNKQEKGHILTIEDPIEFVHKSKSSLITQREVGPHTHSFSSALKASLREDPDVILVGEMRDLETIRLALSAAETGHMVFGTLHTSSAPKTIDRIIDVFPAAEKEMVRSMLSESLKAVISQTLLKTKEGNSRVAAHEIMIGNPAIRNLIRENKIPQMMSVMQTSSREGMQTLDSCLDHLVKTNKITLEAAREKAANKKLFGG